MLNLKKVELLAPAGSIESFYGAINAGADAIYLAGDRFGARAYAENFHTDSLVECIELAHLYNIKVYLTVNTLLKQNEIVELEEYLLPAYKAGLDGVIVQDMGVAKVIHEAFPALELHASTQMTLTGPYSASYLKKLGFSRIVPSRELSLKELKNIKEKVSIELECFIHGAMCYCYSGQCLFSSVLGGRSGNRGRCAQPCRLNYKVIDENGNASEEYYPISMKDQETIGIIDKLIEAGIDSFKIEGRMKKPEYSAGVTSIYRKYIDFYYKSGKLEISPKDLRILSLLYRRSEKQEGYYERQNGRDMITINSPSYNGADEELLNSIRKQYIYYPRHLQIYGYAYFAVGQPAMLTLTYKDISITVEGMEVQAAQKQPISEENVLGQIDKLGDTPFVFENLDISLEEDVFYPLKALNALRRDAIERLKESILLEYGYNSEKYIYTPMKLTKKQEQKQNYLGNCFSAFVQTKEQLDVIVEEQYPLEALYLDSCLLADLQKKDIEEIRNNLPKTNLFIVLPYIFRGNNSSYINRIWEWYETYHDSINGFLVRNLEELEWVKELSQEETSICLDAGMYNMNSYAQTIWKNDAKRITLPYELTRKETLQLLNACEGEIENEKIVYGRIPMMLSANCIAKTQGACKKDGRKHLLTLEDRYHVHFPVEISCENCSNVIYNSVPLCIWENLERYGSEAILRLQFTTESKVDTKRVLDYYYGTLTTKPDFSYTTGFEKREVE